MVEIKKGLVQRLIKSERLKNRLNRFVKNEARLPNMRLASCGVKWLNSSPVFQLEFSGILTVLPSKIPHERQAQNR
jgi:hypothetical protein